MVVILMGEIIWNAVTFTLNLFHLIRAEWWMEGSAYSQIQTTPPDSGIAFKVTWCFCVVSGTVISCLIYFSKPQEKKRKCMSSPLNGVSSSARCELLLHTMHDTARLQAGLTRKSNVNFCCEKLNSHRGDIWGPKRTANTKCLCISSSAPWPSLITSTSLSSRKHLCTTLSSSKFHCELMRQHDRGAKCF